MILICSKEDDPHTIKVASILRGYEEPYFILDTSKFPTALTVSGAFGNGAADVLSLGINGQRLPLSDIKSFWWRRPQPMVIDASIQDPQARAFAFQECVSALYGVLECSGGLWVNDIDRDTTAEYKPLQLKLAREHGFEIPLTLITNSPEEVVEFWNSQEGKVVYKAFNQRGLIWLPTRLMKDEDFALLHNLQHAPAIFQAVVPGSRDVRVTVVGDQVFASEFDIEQLNHVDYRVALNEIRCLPHELPPALVKQILTFMDTLGLEYGGIDFRLTHDGRYIFFEINPDGEFIYIEDRTGQPIAAAMANHLRTGKPARPAKS